ncbi:hypothetical protein OGAPHI_006456 [Ogataea philodendri]|uniref:dolichyl-phosphate-mannose--protein mannosyltransferase n=1 Tax=Ogataea philodendri TaxID=1378263 RepID=A0A9P8T0B7_9ASCO|nr:uncharacterized protein OGAPHI_006456 [Ogataea philodendri]KAH3661608.1 hypothetical protein OGAPHI_006456 [Ogataea philodendri]
MVEDEPPAPAARLYTGYLIYNALIPTPTLDPNHSISQHSRTSSCPNYPTDRWHSELKKRYSQKFVFVLFCSSFQMSLQSESPSYEQVPLDVPGPGFSNRHTSISSMSSASGYTSSTYGGNVSIQAMNANTTGNSVLSGRVSQSRHFAQHNTFNPNLLPQQTNTMMNVTPWIEQQAQVAPNINISSLNMTSLSNEQPHATNLSALTTKNGSSPTANEKLDDNQQSTAPASPHQSHQTSETEKDEDDVIPTAIVIKNIPFAIKKEQLLDVMSKLSLPLPYAFNYHFDNGVFRGLAFANFNSTDETSTVVNVLNGREIGGRKLRVEYKKMLPMVERERIEREKREKRGQLEEQHRSASATSLASLYSISSIPNSTTTPVQANISLLNNTTNSHKLMPDRLYVTLSTQPLALPGNVDFNDPETLEIYSKLIVFKDEIKNPNLTTPTSELAFPLTSMNGNQRKTLSSLCQFLNLAEYFETGFITVKRQEVGAQGTGGTSIAGMAGTPVSGNNQSAVSSTQPAFPPSLIRSHSHNLVSSSSPLSVNAGRYRQQSPRIMTQSTQSNSFGQPQPLQSANSSPNIFQLQQQSSSNIHHSSSAASLNLLRANGQTPLGQQLSGGTSGARASGLPSLGGNAAFFGQSQFQTSRPTGKNESLEKDHRAKSQWTFRNVEAVLGPLVITAIGTYLRLEGLEKNPNVVWDEAHFGKFGAQYLKHEFYHDVHPPLGKMLCGLSEYLAGYNGSAENFNFDSGSKYPAQFDYAHVRWYISWFGSLVVPVCYFTCKEMGYSLWTTYLISLMCCLELSYISLSKFILLDSSLIFFTATTMLCLAKLHTLRNREFSVKWISWLCLTGVSIGCVCSVKWVGLFATALVGLYTVLELWIKFWDPKLNWHRYAKSWVYRVVGLIALPALIYMIFFKIHFGLLYKPGTGAGSLSSLYQANMVDTDVGNYPRNIAIGSKVTIRSQGKSPNLLHSHPSLYPAGSEQHQVTTYGFKDLNNNFVVKKARTQDSYGKYIQDGDLIRLQHELTKSNLHSHAIHAHVSESYWEVSGYGDEEIGDSKDDWVMEIVSQLHSGDSKYAATEKGPEFYNTVHPVTTTFKLRHSVLGCYLATTGESYPTWGFKQGEVVCRPDTLLPFDKSTLWNVEMHENDNLHTDLDYVYPKPRFLEDFFMVQHGMLASNNALVPDPHKFDEIASKWWQWPLLLTGLRMCSWGPHVTKYYLLSHPFTTWFSTLCLGVFVLLILRLMVLWQRQQLVVTADQSWKLAITGLVPFAGWVLHFFPFVVMGRVTYVHHYMPALYFAMYVAGFVVEYLTPRGKWQYAVYGALYGGLLSREGPLAYVWLAANLEKKLTKHQLLHTDIAESTRAIVSSSNATASTEPLALRLTGQLLYGVVRIYSRKAKYLLDDVTDAILKLKSSFKASQSVILPAESTVIPSIRAVTLQDTVTETDLLYQEPLNFDDIFSTQKASQLTQLPEESTTFDRSVEVPRRAEVDELDGVQDDLDLNLDFDLGDAMDVDKDASIELGRAADDDANMSRIMDDVPDFELPEFEEPVLEIDAENEPATPENGQQLGPEVQVEVIGDKRKRRELVFENTDVVRTSRKRVVFDDQIEIPGDIIREQQANYPPAPEGSTEQQLTIETLIKQAKPASSPFADFEQHLFKKRKTEQSPDDQQAQPDQPDDNNNELSLQLPSFDADVQNYAQFDDQDQQEFQEPVKDLLPELDEELESFQTNNLTESQTVSKSTVKVADGVRSLLESSESTTFSDLMAQDMDSDEPLSRNPKREATRTFFELLVLATSDSIELNQDRLFGEIADAAVSLELKSMQTTGNGAPVSNSSWMFDASFNEPSSNLYTFPDESPTSRWFCLMALAVMRNLPGRASIDCETRFTSDLECTSTTPSAETLTIELDVSKIETIGYFAEVVVDVTGYLVAESNVYR